MTHAKNWRWAPAIAGSIRYRLVQNAHRIELKGESMRNNRRPKRGKKNAKTAPAAPATLEWCRRGEGGVMAP
ncbi:MAG: hypothetical protein ACLQGV_15460 [Bryobacteraceae bacterium]